MRRPPRSARQPLAAFVVAPLLVVSSPHLARAAEWTLEPGVGVRTEYSDNVFLTQRNKQSGFSTTIGPGLRANRLTENSSLGLSAGIGYFTNSYSNPKDGVNGSLGANGSWRTERTTYTTALSYLRDSTLASEAFRTGVVTQRVQRNGLFGNVGVSHTLTERWSWNLGGSAGMSRYSQSGSNGLTDNDTWSGGGGLTYAWSSKTQVFTTLNTSHFQAKPLDNTYDTWSLSFGASHQFTERTRIFGSAGYYRQRSSVEAIFVCQLLELAQGPQGFIIVPQQYSQAECARSGVPLTRVALGRDETTNGTVYDAGFSWQVSNRTTLTGYARQGFIPSGIGVLAKTRAFGTTGSHQIDERTRATLDLSAVRASYDGSFTFSPDSWLYYALARVSYDLTRQWILEGGYRYTVVDYFNSPSQGKVNQNAIYGYVRYDWPRVSVSR